MNCRSISIIAGILLIVASIPSQAACSGHASVTATRQAALYSLLHASNVAASAFTVYDEAASANGKLDYVIYSEAAALQASDDQQFAVHLAVLTGTGANQVVSDRADITAMMASGDPGQPGEFDAMLACVTPFLLPSSVQAVAVNAWSVVAGMGSNSSGSDAVYLIDSSNHLALVLTLSTTSSFLQIGPTRSITVDSTIYLVPAPDGTITQIVDEERSYDTSPGSDPPYSQIFELYTWNGAQFTDSGRIDDATAAGKTGTATREVRDDGVPPVVIPAGVTPG